MDGINAIRLEAVIFNLHLSGVNWQSIPPERNRGISQPFPGSLAGPANSALNMVILIDHFRYRGAKLPEAYPFSFGLLVV